MKKLLPFLILLSTPAFALDKEAEASLNAASMILVYRNECQKTERTADLFRKFQEQFAERAGISDGEALKTIIEKSFELTDSFSRKNVTETLCSTMKETFDSGDSSSRENIASNIINKKINLILDSAIVGAIGAAVGLLVGFVGKLATGRNLNARPWWLTGWALGSIVAVRALLAALGHL